MDFLSDARMAQPVDVTAPAPEEIPKQREQLEQKLQLGDHSRSNKNGDSWYESDGD
jgi:hypothetical protein